MYYSLSLGGEYIAERFLTDPGLPEVDDAKVRLAGLKGI